MTPDKQRLDTERLDWIIDQSNVSLGWLDDGVWDDAAEAGPVDCDDVHVTVRAAIDAARVKELK